MRAVVSKGYGGTEAVEVVEVPVPEPGPGQVLIRVEAAAVHPVDLATRAGALVQGGLMGARAVTGLGWDVAGVVEAAGPGAGLAPGDPVLGLHDLLDVPLGTHAEFVVLDSAAVARRPDGLSPVAAAALPLGALTALQALDALGLATGETLLVTGAAGAVGGFAVELAAARGLRVVALAGAADEKRARASGAEWFVDRAAVEGGDLGAAVRALVPGGTDGALDAAVLGVPAQAAVRSRGAFAAVLGGQPLPLRGIRVRNVWVTADGTALAGLAGLAARGVLTPRVADTLPLADAARAHERLAAGGLRGRLVLTP
ncbi:alcohol dehydrogenase catalytic domain-containing protein [Streptomyces avicenniae]|uniref:alcohol dehydrogenase catalytic domain-containing protein n=1 Tax=Streptomyces avicenniae TaxID=500153 RepID=UPI00069AC304|nr:zinc-binding dehydrogenase [Streptomyces avicenniae]